MLLVFFCKMLYAYSNFNNALSQWTNRKKIMFSKIRCSKIGISSMIWGYSHSIIEKKTVHRFSKCHYSNSSLWPCHADLASHTPPCGHDTKSNIFFNKKTQKTSIQYSNLISFTQHLLPINNQREKKNSNLTPPICLHLFSSNGIRQQPNPHTRHPSVFL